MAAVPYSPGRSAAQVDRSLRRSLAAVAEAKKCAVLWFGDVMRRGLHREFGCSSIQQYAVQRLGFSRSRTRDFVHLARKLEDLPRVKEAVASGELGYTKAREVVKVATPATQGPWLEAARRPRRELVREVKRARRAVDPAQGELVPAPEPVTREVPVRLCVEFTPEQEARRAALVERLHKLGAAPAGRAELLLDALAALVEAHEEGPRGPSLPVQIHVHDDGGRLTVDGRELGHADAARLGCDAVVCRPGRRAEAPSGPASEERSSPATATAASRRVAVAPVSSRSITAYPGRRAARTTHAISPPSAPPATACITSGARASANGPGLTRPARPGRPRARRSPGASRPAAPDAPANPSPPGYRTAPGSRMLRADGGDPPAVGHSPGGTTPC